jgi:hypothetical protein
VKISAQHLPPLPVRGKAPALTPAADRFEPSAAQPALLGPAAHYPSYARVGERLAELQEKYPDLCERISLGQSHEGREIWALRLGNLSHETPALDKPGIVITGCTHAREWATLAVPMATAEHLLSTYASDEQSRERLDNSVIWLVPLVNPDGYEFSRSTDLMWRKNRRTSPEANNSDKVGVDLNRNYSDGKPENAKLFRSPYDQPHLTVDDPHACSDSPAQPTYRGPAPASEPEVQAMQKFQLDPQNGIKAVLELHSYGEMILYPWSYEVREVDRMDEYLRLGDAINRSLDYKYQLMPSYALYPVPGCSNDVQHANGILGMTMEIGNSFHPDATALAQLTEQVLPSQLAFIDEVRQMFPAGIAATPDPRRQALAQIREGLIGAGEGTSAQDVREAFAKAGLEELAQDFLDWHSEVAPLGKMDFSLGKSRQFLNWFLKAAEKPGELQPVVEVLYEYGARGEVEDHLNRKCFQALLRAAQNPSDGPRLEQRLDEVGGFGFFGIDLQDAKVRQELGNWRG